MQLFGKTKTAKAGCGHEVRRVPTGEGALVLWSELRCLWTPPVEPGWSGRQFISSARTECF